MIDKILEGIIIFGLSGSCFIGGMKFASEDQPPRLHVVEREVRMIQCLKCSSSARNIFEKLEVEK